MKLKLTYCLILSMLLSSCLSDIVKDNDIPEEIRPKLKIGNINVNNVYTRALPTNQYGDYIYTSVTDGDELTASYNFNKGLSQAYASVQKSYAYVEEKVMRDKEGNDSAHTFVASFSPSIVLPTGGYNWENLTMTLRFVDRWSPCHDVLYASTANDTTVAGGINVNENVLSVRFRHATALLRVADEDISISGKILDRSVSAMSAVVALGNNRESYNFVHSPNGFWSAVVPTALISEAYSGVETRLESMKVVVGSGATEQSLSFNFGADACLLNDNMIYPISVDISPYLMKVEIVAGKITPWESSAISAVSMDEAPGWYYDKESNTYHIYANNGLHNLYLDGADVTHSNISLDASIDVSGFDTQIRRSPIKSIGPGYTFNGKNNTITGLQISSRTGSSEKGVGLVGTNYGTIKNLNIILSGIATGEDIGQNAYLSQNEAEVANEAAVGMLVGRNFGEISNCSAEGCTLLGNGVQYTGGLVGVNVATADSTRGESGLSGIIVNSYTKDINISNVSTGGIGLFVGINKVNDRDGEIVGSIYSCYAEGNVSTTMSTASAQNISGFCADNQGMIMGCCYYGTITDMASSGVTIAGFCSDVSRSSASLFLCYTSDENNIPVHNVSGSRAVMMNNATPCTRYFPPENGFTTKEPQDIFSYMNASVQYQSRPIPAFYYGSVYWNTTQFFDRANEYFPKPNKIDW